MWRCGAELGATAPRYVTAGWGGARIHPLCYIYVFANACVETGRDGGEVFRPCFCSLASFLGRGGGIGGCGECR